MRYNTKGFRGYLNAAATQADGAYVVEREYLELTYIYNNPEDHARRTQKPERLHSDQDGVAPEQGRRRQPDPRADRPHCAEHTGVWVFNHRSGRVRRIGEVGYDNPLFDGLMTHDQIDMFNGPLDRYTIKLIGKKEMLVPYNSYMPVQQQTQVQGHHHQGPHQPGPGPLRTAPRLGDRSAGAPGLQSSLQAPHVLSRRGLLDRAWRRTFTTSAISSGAPPNRTRSTLPTCRWWSTACRCTTTCSRGATSSST